MSDAQATSPSGEVAQDQAPQASEVERDEPRDDNAEVSEAPEGDVEGAPEEVEELELDVAGTKHKFKKGSPIEAAYDVIQQYGKGLEASLTKKGQELGERAKAVETQFKLSERLQGLRGESLAVYAQGVTVQQEIAQLSQVDMNALWQSNPDQARRVSDRLGQLRSQYAEIESSLTQYGKHLNEAERQAVESRAVEGEQIVRKAIKGFSPEIEREVIDYAVKSGVSAEHAKDWRLSPETMVAFYKASQFDKLVAKGNTAAKPAAPLAPEKPVTSIKGGKGTTANSVADLENMPMEEYARLRRKQNSRSR